MLCASGDGEDRPLREQDRALPTGLAQGDVHFAVEYQEELIRVVVDVPDVFALDLGDADVIVTDARDDAGAPQGIEGGQSLAEWDGGAPSGRSLMCTGCAARCAGCVFGT